MFKRAILSKFEWENLPKPLNELFVENLIYDSSTENFAVTYKDSKEVWGLFSVTQRTAPYGIPTQIVQNVYNKGSITADEADFILFNPFNFDMTATAIYVRAYEAIIKSINKALKQHIAASTLVANVYAQGQAELNALKKIYQDFPGIKVLESREIITADDPKMRIVQFEYTPRFKDLEDLKHEIEDDLFMRAGIASGVEITHITDSNLKDSEQARDLVNAYNLKLREDFARRYNEWRKPDKPLRVRIHEINRDNTIKDTGTNFSNIDKENTDNE